MKPRRVKVFAPASISNLGPGFDILGIAINRPGDFVTAERQDEPGLRFSVETNDPRIPSSPLENVAGHVALLMLKELRPGFGVRMILHKKMPLGSGLGSSGASSVASALAVNCLLSKPLKRTDLLKFAVEGERKASGSPHADNVAPSLLGGLCLVRSYKPLDVIQLPVSSRFIWVVVHPHIVVKTRVARSVIPQEVRLKIAIQQWGNVSGLTAGLISGDENLLRKSVEDTIIEPARAHLIPGFYDVKNSALKAGALGCSVSGSGPSVFAVTTSQKKAKAIARSMVRVFHRWTGAKCDVYISRVNSKGAQSLWVRE